MAKQDIVEQKKAKTSFHLDRNRRELAPHLTETHKLITAVQYGDRAALSIRKRMSLDEEGPMPASRALGLLEQYNAAACAYKTAVEVLCKAANIPYPPDKKTKR